MFPKAHALALFFIQFLSFQKIKVQDRQNGASKSFWAYQKKLAGYVPADHQNYGQLYRQTVNDTKKDKCKQVSNCDILKEKYVISKHQ